MILCGSLCSSSYVLEQTRHKSDTELDNQCLNKMATISLLWYCVINVIVSQNIRIIRLVPSSFSLISTIRFPSWQEIFFELFFCLIIILNIMKMMFIAFLALGLIITSMLICVEMVRVTRYMSNMFCDLINNNLGRIVRKIQIRQLKCSNQHK